MTQRKVEFSTYVQQGSTESKTAFMEALMTESTTAGFNCQYCPNFCKSYAYNTTSDSIREEIFNIVNTAKGVLDINVYVSITDDILII